VGLGQFDEIELASKAGAVMSDVLDDRVIKFSPRAPAQAVNLH
jgi:hypothetical protein